MTTTQRRQNLLRSVYLSDGGRYLTNGRFRLTPNILATVGDNNRVYDGAYFILRADLRAVLRNTLLGTMSEIKTYSHKGLTHTTFGVRPLADEIRIGCKTFRGTNATALRDWAFGR